MTKFWRGLKAIFSIPYLHGQIADLTQQRDYFKELWDASQTIKRPSFAQMSQPFDAEPFATAVRERVVNDMSPLLERYALQGLKKIMFTANPGQSTGRAAVLNEYENEKDVADGHHVVQVKVIIPEVRHEFQVRVPNTV